MADHAPQLREPTPCADAALQREIAALFVESLNLDMTADQIDPDAPLYGEGLGLDSIDVLEMALVLSKKYGVQLRANDAEDQRLFRSLRSLADFVAARRAK